MCKLSQNENGSEVYISFQNHDMIFFLLPVSSNSRSMDLTAMETMPVTQEYKEKISKSSNVDFHLDKDGTSPREDGLLPGRCRGLVSKCFDWI